MLVLLAQHQMLAANMHIDPFAAFFSAYLSEEDGGDKGGCMGVGFILQRNPLSLAVASCRGGALARLSAAWCRAAGRSFLTRFSCFETAARE